MVELTDALEVESVETIIQQVETAVPDAGESDRPDPPDVEAVYDLLEHCQQRVEAHWEDWLARIERDDVRVLAEQEGLLVLDAGEQVPYHDLLSGYDGEAAIDRFALGVVRTAHRRMADEFGPQHDWTTGNPLVVALPDSATAGREYVESAVVGLLNRGLSPGQAWAYYGVHVRGHSRNAWAKRCGYSDHSVVSSAVRKAESKLN